MKKTAFMCNSPGSIDRVYADERKEKVREISDLYPTVITAENFQEHVEALKELEAVFSTWGMFKLSEEQLDLLPSLKAVFYAAGSVKGFAEPFLKRGIIVVSAWGANGVPVAEFALAQILLSNKGYFRNIRACVSLAARREAFRGPGNFGEVVALLGAGMIGRIVIELLKPFNL
jgi:phosphoglycerate dehydrogenase-like enzyme